MLKLVAGLSVLCAVLLTVNALYVHTDYYRQLNDVDKFRNLPEGIRVANFGNSHSKYAFDWSYLPEAGGQNMALDSQTLVMDYAIFSQYFDRFADGAVIFIGVSKFSLYIQPLTYSKHGAAYTRYYAFLDARYMPEYSFPLAVQYRYVPALGASVSELMHILRDVPAAADTDEENAVYSISGMDETAMYADGETRIKAALAECPDGTAHGAEYEALTKMLALCAEKHMRAVLVTLPTSVYYDGAWPDELNAAFAGDMEALLASYEGLIWLDYNEDARICGDLSLFRDIDHLNGNGCAVLMRLLADDLAAYGIDLGAFAGEEGNGE